MWNSIRAEDQPSSAAKPAPTKIIYRFMLHDKYSISLFKFTKNNYQNNNTFSYIPQNMLMNMGFVTYKENLKCF